MNRPSSRSVPSAVLTGAALTGAVLLGSLAAGCAPELIPNTDVPDTSENREVITFVEEYRHAVEERNVGALLRLVSPQYLDDNGTIDDDDDRDYDRLREELAAWNERLLDVRYEIRYRRVTFQRDRVLVDYTYTGRFKIQTRQGDRWTRRLADNRIEIVREDGGPFRITSGLKR